jgi:hypothetical protein
MLIIPALRRQRQKDYKFKASLGYIGGSFIKTSIQTKTQIQDSSFLVCHAFLIL